MKLWLHLKIVNEINTYRHWSAIIRAQIAMGQIDVKVRYCSVLTASARHSGRLSLMIGMQLHKVFWDFEGTAFLKPRFPKGLYDQDPKCRSWYATASDENMPPQALPASRELAATPMTLVTGAIPSTFAAPSTTATPSTPATFASVAAPATDYSSATAAPVFATASLTLATLAPASRRHKNESSKASQPAPSHPTSHEAPSDSHKRSLPYALRHLVVTKASKSTHPKTTASGEAGMKAAGTSFDIPIRRKSPLFSWKVKNATAKNVEVPAPGKVEVTTPGNASATTRSKVSPITTPAKPLSTPQPPHPHPQPQPEPRTPTSPSSTDSELRLLTPPRAASAPATTRSYPDEDAESAAAPSERNAHSESEWVDYEEESEADSRGRRRRRAGSETSGEEEEGQWVVV
jgi:hypothetical protein